MSDSEAIPIKSPRTFMRKNYREYNALTYAESADYSGLTVGRIQKLVYEGVIERANRRGIFLVSKFSLDDYLKGRTKLPKRKKKTEPVEAVEAMK